MGGVGADGLGAGLDEDPLGGVAASSSPRPAPSRRQALAGRTPAGAPLPVPPLRHRSAGRPRTWRHPRGGCPSPTAAVAQPGVGRGRVRRRTAAPTTAPHSRRRRRTRRRPGARDADGGAVPRSRLRRPSGRRALAAAPEPWVCRRSVTTRTRRLVRGCCDGPLPAGRRPPAVAHPGCASCRSRDEDSPGGDVRTARHRSRRPRRCARRPAAWRVSPRFIRRTPFVCRPALRTSRAEVRITPPVEVIAYSSSSMPDDERADQRATPAVVLDGQNALAAPALHRIVLDRGALGVPAGRGDQNERALLHDSERQQPVAAS